MADTQRHKVSPIDDTAEGAARTARIVNTSAVVERLPVGVLVCSVTSANVIEALFVNGFAREVFSLTESTVLPCPLDTIWNSADNHVLAGQVLEVFRTARDSNFEWSIRAGVIERFLSSHLMPLLDHEAMSIR
ncbi:hypothetical protein [Kordiimonas gwangyangensis]|uniref:hypothetical protein n=1 Tax=Kordiimonas gwangyangensis TaxID=288022 RepID=UPI00056682DD|nr:hypothetical protein [Kordiimonas gwangyangensis]